MTINGYRMLLGAAWEFCNELRNTLSSYVILVVNTKYAYSTSGCSVVQFNYPAGE
jgi:hypothetical protein